MHDVDIRTMKSYGCKFESMEPTDDEQVDFIKERGIRW